VAKTMNFERRLRIAGTLVLLGLLVELVSLLWSHPLAFIVFVVGGGLLIAAGILVYLYSVVSRDGVLTATEAGH
jgi:hypothetical protein